MWDKWLAQPAQTPVSAVMPGLTTQGPKADFCGLEVIHCLQLSCLTIMRTLRRAPCACTHLLYHPLDCTWRMYTSELLAVRQAALSRTHTWTQQVILALLARNPDFLYPPTWAALWCLLDTASISQYKLHVFWSVCSSTHPVGNCCCTSYVSWQSSIKICPSEPFPPALSSEACCTGLLPVYLRRMHQAHHPLTLRRGTRIDCCLHKPLASPHLGCVAAPAARAPA